MAANLAGLYPSLVTALVLVNSAGPLTPGYDPQAPPKPRGVPPALVVNAITAALLFYLERSVPATLRRCYPTNPDNADAWLAAEIFRAACDPGAAAVFASVFYLPPPPPLNWLVDSFGGPTLVLQGALDPLNDAPARAAKLAALSATASVQLLQAGHCPHDELPREWNAAVRALLG
jgi:pimeloyl-ACP methyl ester carboxylesterase